jgi:osmotically-inducible protein OsmY
VASQAGKARAAEIARKTEGVTRVQDNLRIGVASSRPADRDMKDAAHDAKENTKEAARDTKRETKDAASEMREEGREAREDARENAREAKEESKETAREAKRETKETARDVGRETREATGTTGQAVNDGWITTKVKSSFVGVDALDGSDIDVDTSNHVVTLRGTVPSQAGRAKAVSLAKQVDGVKSVKDELTIAAKK